MKRKNNTGSALARAFFLAMSLSTSSLALTSQAEAQVQPNPMGDFIEQQIQSLNKLKVPNVILGDVDDNSAHFFLNELEQIKQEVGKGTPAKGPYIYVRLKSRGGDVKEGRGILRTLNQSLDNGYQVRVVCEEASSVAAVILSGFKGMRFATKECSGVFHGSYFIRQNPDGTFDSLKSGDPRLSREKQFSLDDTNHGFAAYLSQQSCRINHKLARAFFTADDTSFTMKDLIELNIIDHVLKVTKGGFYSVDESFDKYKKPCTEEHKTEQYISADGFVQRAEDEKQPKLLEQPRPASPSQPSAPRPPSHPRK